MKLNQLNTKYPQKRAILTGANSGVGFEMLKILLANDWFVLAIDQHIDELSQLQSEHSSLEVRKVDITDRSLYENTLRLFCETHEGVDVLFNNAGVGEGVRFKDYPLENWDWIIDINLKTVIHGCYTVLDPMRRQGHGLIVNMASAAGYANLPNMSPYNVTKAGVIALSESLAHEFSPYDIQVLCVTPTFFRSNILKNSKGTADVLESAHRVVAKAKMDSRQAAIEILSNLHKAKENLRFPFSARGIYYGRKIFPKLYKRLVRRLLVK